MIPLADDGIVVAMAHSDVTPEEPRTIRELLERMADVLSAPDPHRAVIQEIITGGDARKRADVVEVREIPPPYETDGVSRRLDGLEHAIAQVQRSIDELRGVVATKVEVESVRDAVRRIADGYAHISAQLRESSELLKRFLTDVPR